MEYPGYGARSGSHGEASFVDAALQAAQAAHEEFGAPLYLWGESIGAGVAAGALAAKDGVLASLVDGIVLMTPFDNLTTVAQRHYPWLPVRWLLRDRYENARNLAAFSGHAAVIVCGRDTVVPPLRGKSLYQSMNEPKRLWEFETAGHNDWPSDEGSAWWSEVMTYLQTGQ